LVESSVGGRHGGGTHLTDYGRRLVGLYRAMEQEYQDAVDRLARGMDAAEPGDQQEFQSLLKRMSMRTSARNQLVGTLIALRKDEVSAEAVLSLDDRTRVVAIVTRDSAEELGLKPGIEVHALVKASSVVLSTDPGLKTSARNQI
jgi:molybdate transport system regulatory protein